MRTAAIALGVVTLCACKGKSETTPERVETTRSGAPAADVSEADYAKLLIAELEAHPGSGSATKFTYDPQKSLVTDGNAQIATTNLYAEYVKLPPEQRAGALRQVAASFTSSHEEDTDTLAKVRGQLLPAVRAGMYFDYALQMKATDKPLTDTAVFVPLGELTGAGVAIDRDASMLIATKKQLEKWQLSLDQAMEIAVANLAAKGVPFREVSPGVWTSPAHDNYDSSRIFLYDEIAKLKLKGTVVAVIPNRDTLYLASADDPKALLAMADLADKAAEEPRPIHTAPLCLSGKTWSDCEPGSTPVVKARMHALATTGRQSLYGEQKEALQERLGDDIFVASYTVIQNKDSSRLASYATWTRTVPTLLPRADFIGFVELEGVEPDLKPHVIGMVPWDKAVKILGKRLTPDGRNPPRWATGEYWPTKAELAALAPQPDPFK